MKAQKKHIKDLLSATVDAAALANLQGGNQPISGNAMHDLVTPASLAQPYTDTHVNDVPN